ncbi:MAG: hypothetical protein LBV12_00535 [Puniceicoccales bacterium]|jgi:hypothetical protein|nr:hypothetical protein [Puniceicoccales bacterium]
MIIVRTIKKIVFRKSPVSSATLAGCLLIAAVGISGCAESHVIPSTKGGEYIREETITAYPATSKKEVLVQKIREHITQNENAKSESSFSRASDGATKLTFGESRLNAAIVPPVPNYTPYLALGCSLLMLAGGSILIGAGWPQIGWRLAIGGACGSVISLTVEKYGWLYAIAILGGIGLISWEKYTAYRKGELNAA